MSTRAKIASTVMSAGILLIGWLAATAGHGLGLESETEDDTAADPSASTASPDDQSAATAQPPGTGTSASANGTRPGVGAPTTATGDYVDGTYTGTEEFHRFGSVTVTVTITNGLITEVADVTTAADSRSQSIDARAIPALRSRVLSAQSAEVDTISGATLTSGAYLGSLQAALDEARA